MLAAPTSVWDSDSDDESSPPRPPPRFHCLFPPELVEMITEYLVTNESSLRQCSLVSRAWTRAFQKRLFANVFVRIDRNRGRRSGPVNRLYDVLNHSPHLGAYVRYLNIDLSDTMFTHEHQAVMFLVLSSMPNLTKLALSGSHRSRADFAITDALYEAIQKSLALPCLTDFSLSTWCISDLNPIIGLLQKRKSPLCCFKFVSIQFAFPDVVQGQLMSDAEPLLVDRFLVYGSERPWAFINLVNSLHTRVHVRALNLQVPFVIDHPVFSPDVLPILGEPFSSTLEELTLTYPARRSEILPVNFDFTSLHRLRTLHIISHMMDVFDELTSVNPDNVIETIEISVKYLEAFEYLERVQQLDSLLGSAYCFPNLTMVKIRLSRACRWPTAPHLDLIMAGFSVLLGRGLLYLYHPRFPVVYDSQQIIAGTISTDSSYAKDVGRPYNEEWSLFIEP